MSDENDYEDDFDDSPVVIQETNSTVEKSVKHLTETELNTKKNLDSRLRVDSLLRSGLIRHASTSPLIERVNIGIATEKITIESVSLQVPEDIDNLTVRTVSSTSLSTTTSTALQIAAPRLAEFLKTVLPLMSNLLDELSAEAIIAQKDIYSKSKKLSMSSEQTSRLMPVLSSVGLMKDIPLLLQRKIVCVAQSPADHRDFALAFGPMPATAAALLVRKHGVSVLQHIREGSIVICFSNGKLSSVLSCSSQQITCLMFPDDKGMLVVAGCSDGLIHVWNRKEPSINHLSSCGSGVVVEESNNGSETIQRFISLPVEGGLRSPSCSVGGLHTGDENSTKSPSLSFLNESCSILNMFLIKRNNDINSTTGIMSNSNENDIENKNITRSINSKSRLRTGAGLKTLLFSNDYTLEMSSSTTSIIKGQTETSLKKQGSVFQIGSIDSRGKLDIWVIIQNTESTKITRVDSLSSSFSSLDMKFEDSLVNIGPYCCDATASSNDVSEYIVALSSGRLLRVLRMDSNNITGRPAFLPRIFHPHILLGVSATKVVFNPVQISTSSNEFSPPVNLIAAGFSDGTICLYSSRHESPIATLTFTLSSLRTTRNSTDIKESGDLSLVTSIHGSRIVLLQWLRHRPTVLIALDEFGVCAVFDLYISLSGPIFLVNMSPQEGFIVKSAACTGCGPREPVSHVSILALFTEKRKDEEDKDTEEDVDVKSTNKMYVLKLHEEFCTPENNREIDKLKSLFVSMR
jgi:hypothetical protein